MADAAMLAATQQTVAGWGSETAECPGMADVAMSSDTERAGKRSREVSGAASGSSHTHAPPVAEEDEDEDEEDEDYVAVDDEGYDSDSEEEEGENSEEEEGESDESTLPQEEEGPGALIDEVMGLHRDARSNLDDVMGQQEDAVPHVAPAARVGKGKGKAIAAAAYGGGRVMDDDSD